MGRLSWPTWFVLILVAIINALLLGISIVWQIFGWLQSYWESLSFRFLSGFIPCDSANVECSTRWCRLKEKQTCTFREQESRDPYTKISAKWKKENENTRN